MFVKKVLPIFLILVVKQILCGKNSFEPCPDYPAVKNFDTTLFLGKWYEIERTDIFLQPQGECGTVEYSINTYTKSVKCLSTVTIVNPKFGYERREFEGVISYPEQISVEGKFNLTSGLLPSSEKTTFTNYWVLHIEYKSLMIGIFCLKMGGRSYQNAWILSRTTYITEEMTVKIQEFKKKPMLKNVPFRKVIHDEEVCRTAKQAILVEDLYAISESYEVRSNN